MQITPSKAVISFLSQPKVNTGALSLRAANQDNEEDVADNVPTSRALGTTVNIRT